jgi:gluconokinase
MAAVSASQAEAPLVLTIDAGTSSARALLFDARGRAVEGMAAQERYHVRSTDEGASEDDPDEALERVSRCVDAALQQAGRLADAIGAVAVDTLVTNMLAIDQQGRPITPLITYADTRAAPDAEALRKRLDERAAHQRTGCLLRTAYWPARLAWFQRTQPEIWHNAARWITLGEYLELKLFGRSRASFSAASWSGLLDRRKLEWDAPLLDALGLAPERLGQLADVDTPLQGLREPYARRWPALAKTPWFPAIGDGAAANIGSGCVGQQRIALTVGTTGALRVAQPDVAEVPPGLWCYRVDRRYALLGGATSEGGNVYAWMRDTLRLGEPAQLEHELSQLPPDEHGLTLLPFLAGERSPGWAGDARAAINGMTLATTPIQILQAGLEAVAYRFALIARALISTDRQQEPLFIASGGALLSSPFWMQTIADVLGWPVVASKEAEATSRGVALLALRSIGAIGALDELPADDGAAYEPNTERHAIYREAVERQQELYASLIVV